MVVHDVTRKPPGRQVLLVARLHVDLCRLASAACTTAPPRAAGRAWGHRPRA
ncbi:putative leader peptide [Streptomyces sp. CMB-StM0423]|uniref:putative leader peptide n=1 Tax=Streptomyces sp. CMB-StM0423 TaxID=2059884 RepID=UPI002D780FD9|nr:putative leader peptide [Streptomyces sp. CMB-StM0423]